MIPSASHNAPGSAIALLAGVVDYAGLFPPASLTMRQAADAYAEAMASADAWMLGRFIIPASRLPELAREFEAQPAPPSAWHISAIVGNPDADLAAIDIFNASVAQTRAFVDAIECRPTTIDDIAVVAAGGRGLEVYIEIPANAATMLWMDRIAALNLRAKIRTGGVTADAFPSPASVIAFIAETLRAGVTFKATAGLHHAVRGSYRLTYAADTGRAPMYGYLNVLLATAALVAGLDAARAEELLVRSDTTSLVFSDDAVYWNDMEFPTAALSAIRTAQLVGFGSCSFSEPSDELRALVPNSNSPRQEAHHGTISARR